MFTPVSHFQGLSDSQAPMGLTKWISMIGGPVTIWFSPLLIVLIATCIVNKLYKGK